MTHKDRQAAREQVAREWLICNGLPYWDEGRLIPTRHGRSLVDLLAATEAAVLEEVATHIEEVHEHDFAHRQLFGIEKEIVHWLRQQAAERNG